MPNYKGAGKFYYLNSSDSQNLKTAYLLSLISCNNKQPKVRSIMEKNTTINHTKLTLVDHNTKPALWNEKYCKKQKSCGQKKEKERQRHKSINNQPYFRFRLQCLPYFSNPTIPLSPAPSNYYILESWWRLVAPMCHGGRRDFAHLQELIFWKFTNNAKRRAMLTLFLKSDAASVSIIIELLCL